MDCRRQGEQFIFSVVEDVRTEPKQAPAREWSRSISRKICMFRMDICHMKMSQECGDAWCGIVWDGTENIRT